MSDSVLVIHNSEEVYSFFSDFLVKEGYTVYNQRDGLEALNVMIDQNPSLIVIGSDTPTVDSASIIKYACNTINKPIICMSAESKNSVAPELRSKVDAFFKLPLNPDIVIKKTNNLLYNRRIKEKGKLLKRKHYRSETYLYHLFENIKIATISLDKDGKILSFNKKAQQLWGYQRNFIIGRDFGVLCLLANKDKCAPIFIEETMDSGSYSGVLFFERADGTTFPGKLQTSIIKDDNAKDEGIVVVIRDLTKQRELEEKFLDKEKLATLGMVVEGVAHEVRNPLISIGGFARRMLKKVGEDFPFRNYLKVIVEDVSRLEAMVKDIETYVHFTKLHKANFKKGRIENVLETAFEMLEGGSLRNIEVITEYDPTMPALYLDVGYLVEMMYNLLENAVEAMPTGGTLTIKTLCDNHTNCVVRVIDSGCGIPKDKIDDIFNLFYTTKMSGVGLGLAKAHIIIDEHKGAIEVESIPGSGTTVTVTLPLERRQKIRR